MILSALLLREYGRFAVVSARPSGSINFGASRFFCNASTSKKSSREEAAKKIYDKTPKGRLDDDAIYDIHKTQTEEKDRNGEKEQLKKWPGGVNPHSGEVDGPAGPEPTRYGDWERKGRTSDF